MSSRNSDKHGAARKPIKSKPAVDPGVKLLKRIKIDRKAKIQRTRTKTPIPAEQTPESAENEFSEEEDQKVWPLTRWRSEGKFKVRDCGCKYPRDGEGAMEMCVKHKAAEHEADQDLTSQPKEEKKCPDCGKMSETQECESIAAAEAPKEEEQMNETRRPAEGWRTCPQCRHARDEYWLDSEVCEKCLAHRLKMRTTADDFDRKMGPSYQPTLPSHSTQLEEEEDDDTA